MVPIAALGSFRDRELVQPLQRDSPAFEPAVHGPFRITSAARHIHQPRSRSQITLGSKNTGQVTDRTGATTQGISNGPKAHPLQPHSRKYNTLFGLHLLRSSSRPLTLPNRQGFAIRLFKPKGIKIKTKINHDQ